VKSAQETEDEAVAEAKKNQFKARPVLSPETRNLESGKRNLKNEI